VAIFNRIFLEKLVVAYFFGPPCRSINLLTNVSFLRLIISTKGAIPIWSRINSILSRICTLKILHNVRLMRLSSLFMSVLQN